MLAVIPCAGNGERWANYLGVEKFMTPVDGEPLLYRTARMLAERGIEWIYVTLKSPLPAPFLAPPGTVRLIVPPVAENRIYTLDSLVKFANALPVWAAVEDGDSICYLHGDTYYTDAALDTICAPLERPFQAYGRMGASVSTGKQYGEPYAFRWAPTVFPEVLRLFARIEERYRKGSNHWSAGRELYLGMAGLPLDRMQSHPMWTEIDDLTEDFDCAEDYENWLERYERSTQA